LRKISKASFFEAVQRWSVRDVAAAVREQPALVSLRDALGRTALHVCSRRALPRASEASAAVATARVLLEARADVNAVHPIQDDGEVFPATALWYALAWGRNHPLASYLLRRKANPNHCMFALVFADDLTSAKLLRRYEARIDEAFDGETPLIYAMRHRRARFGEWLLREGADPNFRDARGLTALHHAVRRRLPDSMLRLLVKHGADVRVVSRTGISVGQLATRAQKRLLGIEGAR